MPAIPAKSLKISELLTNQPLTNLSALSEMKRPSKAQMEYWDQRLAVFGLNESRINRQDRWLYFSGRPEYNSVAFDYTRRGELHEVDARASDDREDLWGYTGGYDFQGQSTGGFKEIE